MRINTNSKEFADALFDFLYENGLSLSSGTTSKVIEVGRGETDWSVVDYDQINGKPYKTLSGAIKSVNN